MRNDSEAAIEQQIQDKGLNAPRLTPEHIDAQIVAEHFHVFEGTTLTVCALTLRNGFQVIGMSAAASPENFNPTIGRSIARKNAREQIWQLEGYLLKERLSGNGWGDLKAMRPAALEAMKYPPFTFQYRGMQYETASRMAQAICRAAGETGVTVNAAKHLVELHAVMGCASAGKVPTA
jgi:hypothetical protein